MPEAVFREKMFGSSRRLSDPRIPFLIFGPVALALFLYCLRHSELGLLQITGGLLGAILFWTLYEYVIHRFFFHLTPRNSFWEKLLYTIHIGHHDYPNDKRLMLLGLEVSVPGFFIFYTVFYLLLGHPLVHAFMLGMVCCYLFYDWLHYAAHNSRYKNKLFKYYQRHHMEHHFQAEDKNYGFITTTWDKILGTKLKHKER